MSVSNHFEDSKQTPFGLKDHWAQLHAELNELFALLSGYGLQEKELLIHSMGIY